MAAGANRRRWIIAATLVAVVVAVLAVIFVNFTGPPQTSPSASALPDPAASADSTASADSAASASPAPTSSVPAKNEAEAKLGAMSVEQKVGQILMVSSAVTGADADTLHALDTLFVGNVFLKGRSTQGVAGISAEVATLAAHIGGDRTQGVRPFVATDQEGGLVQVMRGPGFTEMPQAIVQGQLDPATLQSNAAAWGGQLAAVGVNVNLAPVFDTVPGAEFAPQNAPIGAFGREYGYTPETVSSHGIAFAKGMMSAGVDPAVKHFPGLGRVNANTDVASGVSDPVTVRKDPYIQPFQDAVAAGVPWLMISNAGYPAIDSAAMAPFSTIIVNDMVRADLGFKGIIVSDDMCDAVQLAAVPVAERGVDFIAAGGTMALCTNQALLPAMYAGLVAAASANAGFAQQVNAAALLVLQAKADKGLLD